MRTPSFAAACIFLITSSAHASDIFVDNVLGDDRRGGSVPVATGEGGGPCRSIAKALRITLPGDRIIIANTGRPYRESITVQGPRHSGSERYPTTIIGNGATLDGTISMAESQWEFAGNNTFRTRPIHKSHQQVFLDDQPAVRRQPLAGMNAQLQPREWCLLEGWLYFRVDEGKLPDAYNLSCCGEQVGITLYEVHDVIVQDLTLRGFWLDGVNCHDSVTRTDLVNLNANHNGRSGISIGGASRVRVNGCTASGNGVAQIRVEGYSLVQLLNNALDASSAPAILREGGRLVDEKGE